MLQLIDWSGGGYLLSDKPMPRGEIVIGGPNVTLEYFKSEDKTNEVYKVCFDFCWLIFVKRMVVRTLVLSYCFGRLMRTG